MAKVLYMFGKLHYHMRDFADALLRLGHVEFEREGRPLGFICLRMRLDATLFQCCSGSRSPQ
jgi:hypothetical protein